MNRKSSTLIHAPSQVPVQTPLLIPSFSSRGYRGFGHTSELRRLFNEATQFATESYLISAYDVAKGHIPPLTELTTKPELIVLDSGGYEVSGILDFAFSAPEADNVWTPDDLQSVLAAWPEDQASIFVSYDHPRKFCSLEQQTSEARKLSKKFNRHLHCFLVKPESAEVRGSLKPVLAKVAVNADLLRGFDVIGVTDKGLGTSPIDRMMQIAKLRRALDEANCHAPLHVFGSLDPLSICLYYLAGAEIFDGLTWLRLSFTAEACVYPSGHEPQARGLHVKDSASDAQRLVSNYQAILALQEKLRFFARTGDFKLLPHSDFLQEASVDLRSRFLT